MKKLLIIVLLMACPVVVSAGPMLPASPSAVELSMLPPYCKVRTEKGLDRADPTVRRWFDLLGPNYLDIHHHCMGLNYINRAMKNDEHMKFYQRSAIGNFEYMIKAAKPGFVLLPDAHIERGRVLEMTDRKGKAIADYEKAIQLKPDYPRAYSVLIDLYMTLGRKDEARKVIDRGLKQIPNSKSLRRRAKKLAE